MTTATVHTVLTPILEQLDLTSHPLILPANAEGDVAISMNPGDGTPLAAVRLQTKAEYNQIVEKAMAVQREWRMLPAPKRGELVRRMGNAFRDQIEPLGELVALEMGKIRPEGIGEIQECVDYPQRCSETDHSRLPRRDPASSASSLSASGSP